MDPNLNLWAGFMRWVKFKTYFLKKNKKVRFSLKNLFPLEGQKLWSGNFSIPSFRNFCWIRLVKNGFHLKLFDLFKQIMLWKLRLSHSWKPLVIFFHAMFDWYASVIERSLTFWSREKDLKLIIFKFFNWILLIFFTVATYIFDGRNN